MDAEKVSDEELIKRLIEECPVPIEVKWRHYKNGHTYEVVGRCIHEATQEPMVVYRRADGPYRPSFCRPASEWSELVEHEGKTVPRFELVK